MRRPLRERRRLKIEERAEFSHFNNFLSIIHFTFKIE
jgi:hypothetical protein